MLVSEAEIVLKLQNYTFQESALAGGSQTIVEPIGCSEDKTFRFTNEFWTARQRQASSIHEISYRVWWLTDSSSQKQPTSGALKTTAPGPTATALSFFVKNKLLHSHLFA